MPLVVPYVEQVWVDGSGGGTPISAARLNVAEAGIKAAHYMPAVRVYHNAAQTLTTAVETALAFNTELYDQASNVADTMHDNVTLNTRLTCRYAGVYHVSGNVDFVANATGQRRISVRVNSTASQYLGLDRRPGQAGFTTTCVLGVDLALAVNDYVELIALQDSGGNLNVNAGTALAPYACQFSMVRVA